MLPTIKGDLLMFHRKDGHETVDCMNATTRRHLEHQYPVNTETDTDTPTVPGPARSSPETTYMLTA